MRNLLPLLCFACLPGAAEDLYLRNATIHPVTSPEIRGGAILIRDGRIAEVGLKIAAPKAAKVIDLKGAHVYPGMIDAATQLGLTEIPGVGETNDINELGLFKPQLHAIRAINPASEHFPVTRANGVTAALVQPGGGIITGQAALVHLAGWTWEQMQIKAPVGLRIDFPVLAPLPGPPGTQQTFAEQKRRRDAQIRELEEFFEQARHYSAAKTAARSDFATDLKLEAMLPVLRGEVPLLIRADRDTVIRDALQFSKKQNLRMVLVSGREAWKITKELKAQDVPVILGPTLALPSEEDDPYDRVLSTPRDLQQAGVKFCFGTFGPTASDNPRSLPYQAGNAVAYGLPYDEALKSVTLRPAEILGLAKDLGSIEAGKIADLVVTDGDPLEIRTQVLQLFIAGKRVELENKHLRLYERYINRN